MKIVKAIQPYTRHNGSNFKFPPYNEWVNNDGKVSRAIYPIRHLHGLAHKVELPSFNILSSQARLRFVEAFTINFDCWPDYLWCETIPFIWDCWPSMYDRIEKWFYKHNIRTAIFTSSITAEEIRQRCPDVNILHVTEGIDTSVYHAGGSLVRRSIDFLEYGSKQRNLFEKPLEGINHVNSTSIITKMMTWDDLLNTMSDAKVTLALPRCDIDQEVTGGVETLTQRFWEGMLSRSVLVGRAPKELTDLIGYNPVITLDRQNAEEQIKDIIAHIDDFQSLVDKNREVALTMAPWNIRIKKIMNWLTELGYKI
ncbi:MAG: hypothetical protein MR860_04955 [Prevotella sp.]|nr:hypothetical protein [Prevotella sp.]